MNSASQVSSAVLSFFKDPNASSVLSLSGQQVIAPTVRGQDLTADEIGMGGGVRIAMHIFDRSPSMSPVTKLMLDGFGKHYVPAIQEARADDVAALRIGGIAFSSDIKQIWKKGGLSFHTLQDLPPLTKAEYDPDRGSGTALHQSIIDGYHLALEYAAQVQQDTGIQPEIDIIVLSDGYNNEAPRDPKVVKQLIKGSKPDLVRWIYFYFDTTGGTFTKGSDDDPEKIAKNLGFDLENIMIFEKKSSESDKEYASRFRRMLRVMSRVSASKGTSAVVAAAAVQAAASAGGKGDDDIL